MQRVSACMPALADPLHAATATKLLVHAPPEAVVRHSGRHSRSKAEPRGRSHPPSLVGGVTTSLAGLICAAGGGRCPWRSSRWPPPRRGRG